MVQRIITFANDETGASSIEYGLVASLVAVVIVAAVTVVKLKVGAGFATVASSLGD